MRFYISDLHFFHESLNTKMDKRGFEDCNQMHEYIIEKWNNKVRTGDEVVIIGDISLGNAEKTNELLGRLNGRLYLITGNHDHVVLHRKFDSSRFVWIKDYAEMNDNGRKVVLCHYPIMFYNGQYRLDKNGKPSTYMLYGHVHDTKDALLMDSFILKTRNTVVTDAAGVTRTIPCNIINCFCKYSDYVPLSLDEWVEFDEKRRNDSLESLID